MKDINLDLGNSDPCGGCCPSPLSSSEVQKWYPSLHLELKEEDDVELPDEGTIVLKFRKKREVEESNRDKSKTCSYDLEVLKLVSVDGEEVTPPAKSSGKEAGDSLDAIRAKKIKDAEAKNEDY